MSHDIDIDEPIPYVLADPPPPCRCNPCKATDVRERLAQRAAKR